MSLLVTRTDRNRKGNLDSGSHAEIGVDAQPSCTPRRCQWPVLTAMFHSYFGVSPTQRIYILTYILQIKAQSWDFTQL